MTLLRYVATIYAAAAIGGLAAGIAASPRTAELDHGGAIHVVVGAFVGALLGTIAATWVT